MNKVNKTISWNQVPCEPVETRVWLCTSYHDAQQYDCAAKIVARSEAGSVTVELPNGFRCSPGIRTNRWTVTSVSSKLIKVLKKHVTLVQVRDCAYSGAKQAPEARVGAAH